MTKINETVEIPSIFVKIINSDESDRAIMKLGTRKIIRLIPCKNGVTRITIIIASAVSKFSKEMDSFRSRLGIKYILFTGKSRKRDDVMEIFIKNSEFYEFSVEEFIRELEKLLGVIEVIAKVVH